MPCLSATVTAVLSSQGGGLGAHFSTRFSSSVSLKINVSTIERNHKNYWNLKTQCSWWDLSKIPLHMNCQEPLPCLLIKSLTSKSRYGTDDPPNHAVLYLPPAIPLAKPGYKDTQPWHHVVLTPQHSRPLLQQHLLPSATHSPFGLPGKNRKKEGHHCCLTPQNGQRCSFLWQSLHP